MKRTGVDWLAWLADQSREHEVFRHDLDRWGTPTERAEHTQRLLGKVTEFVTGCPQDTYLAAREQERPSRRHVATSGVFGPVTDVANIEQVTQSTGVNADVLARTLLDEGLCAELTDELAAGYLGTGSHTP